MRHHVCFVFHPERFVAPIVDAECTVADGALVHEERHAHFEHTIREQDDGTLVADYRFDETYARAHPESLDRAHLAFVHGTIASKMFDDGARVLHGDNLLASVRWKNRTPP